MLESGRPRNTRGQGIKTPELLQEAEDRGVGVLSTFVASLVLDGALFNPWGDKYRRHADTQALEVEGDVLSIRGLLGVADVVTSWHVDGGRNVISESSVLIEGQDEQGVLPLGGVADSLVDVLDEELAVGDWGRRVEGLVAAALRVDVRELRQRPGLSIGVELFERGNVGLGRARREGPLVESSIRVESQSRASGGVLVVHPRDVGLAQLLEDAALGETVDVE